MWPQKRSRPGRRIVVALAMNELNLQQRLRTIENEQRRVRLEMRRAARNSQRIAEVTDWKWKVGCAIVALSNGNVDVGVAYFLYGKGDAGKVHFARYKNILAAWWRERGHLAAGILTPTTTQGRQVLRRARKFLAEHDLVRWVRGMNLEHGISPDSTLLNAKRPVEDQGASKRTRTQWAARFRHRWGLSLGRFAARERLTRAEKQAKALAMWQWARFLHSRIPLHKEPLLINMDETCIRLYQRGKLGHMVLEARRQKRQGDALTQNVSLSQQRGACTLVALVSNCHAAQQLLPQTILMSEKTMPSKKLKEIAETLPGHVIVRSGPKGWMNGTLMKALYRDIEKRLRPLKDTHQIIFAADTYGCHITKEAIAYSGRLGMWTLVIPAKMTWALQPLDTHVFARFKSSLVSTWQSMQVEEANPSMLDWSTMIKAITKTIDDVLRDESWARAFEHNGLTGNTRLISERVRAKIGLSEVEEMLPRLPTAVELHSIFPRSCSNIPIDELFGHWTGRFVRSLEPPVWHGRLRSAQRAPTRLPVARPLFPGVPLPL